MNSTDSAIATHTTPCGESRHNSRPRGMWPVMLTPFDAAFRIDWKGLDALVDWYASGGSEGLFGVCYSSEMFALEPDERIALVRHIAARAKRHDMPLIAAGAFPAESALGQTCGSARALADAAHKLAEAGACAVIFLANQFAEAEDEESRFLDNLAATLSLIDPALPLGLYECPLPYKRLLTPESTAWAAATGRFRFLKDTCCDISLIREKLKAVAGSPLRFYNANTATLLESLKAGGHGFSGVGANAVPQLYAWLCQNFDKFPRESAALQAFLNESAPHVDNHYPHSVKTYLHIHGLPLEPYSRLCDNALTNEEIKKLAEFHAMIRQWEERLGIPSPFAHRS